MGSTSSSNYNVPPQAGKVVIITGANSGLGFETSLALAQAGAKVILACRDPNKAEDALDRIRAACPSAASDGRLEFEQLDLASMTSIREFADRVSAKHDKIDVLINNAGVMAVDPRKETEQGWEMQIGTNHLAHFALTGLLLHNLNTNARIVNHSSSLHSPGVINFEDLHSQQNYSPWTAYCQSKLANVLFTFELDKRLRQLQPESGIISVSCHPGYSDTNLQQGTYFRYLNVLCATRASHGAQPQIRAATDPTLKGGEYVGPRYQMFGTPVIQTPSARSRNADVQRRLWEVSVQETGVEYLKLE